MKWKPLNFSFHFSLVQFLFRVSLLNKTYNNSQVKRTKSYFKEKKGEKNMNCGECQMLNDIIFIFISWCCILFSFCST